MDDKKKSKAALLSELSELRERVAQLERIHIAGTGIDVTDRPRSEEKYRSIFENAVEGIYQVTPEGRFISANPALAKMLGYETSEEMISHVHDVGTQLYVNPDERVRVKHLLEEHDMVRGFEMQLRRKDGRVIWAVTNTHTVRDEAGKVLYHEGTMEDITERKRAEEALRISEANLRTILDSVNDAVFIHTMDGRVIDVNTKVLDMYRVSRKEALSMSIANDFSAPEYPLEAVGEKIWESALGGGKENL